LRRKQPTGEQHGHQEEDGQAARAPARTPSFWSELYERGLDLATGVAMGAKLASGGGMHDIIEIGKERLRFRH
jgi:hypothetical protein